VGIENTAYLRMGGVKHAISSSSELPGSFWTPEEVLKEVKIVLLFEAAKEIGKEIPKPMGKPVGKELLRK